MLRLAKLSSLIALASLALGASARPAVASDPLSTYVVPTLVELQPNDAEATRVYIRGAFFQLTSATDLTYGAPKCGSMYFQCVAGQEAMCRMQWMELRAAISAMPTLCEGFGSLHVVSTATVDTEPRVRAPDAWDLGMGISQGVYVDGKCPMAIALKCEGAPPPPAPDGAAPDAAGGDTDAAGGGTDATGGDTDAAGGGDADAAAPEDAPAQETPTAPPPHDAAADAPPKLAHGGGGCSLGGGARSSVALAALGVALLWRARRRRR